MLCRICLLNCLSMLLFASDSFKLLHALDAEWGKVTKEEIESQSIYFDVFTVSIDIPDTRALLLECRSLKEFDNSVFEH